VYDALIIGAGPAGCSAARLLAAWGHRVALVDRPGAESHRLAESIPPSAARVLATLGALPAVEDAGFQPWRGNLVWWGEETGPGRRESFPPGVAGYQVRREAFDARLRELARQSGAELVAGGVRDVRLGGEPAATIDRPGGAEFVAARMILDCSGRAGVVARRGFRRTDAVHTIAMAGTWQTQGERPEAGDAYTLVASYADGWAWSIAPAAGVRDVAVMIDPVRTGRQRDAASRDVYLAEVAKVEAFRPVLAGATLVAGPWGADASAYDARAYAGQGFVLAGDAASFIDPLSSFGVKKALASGWLAAIVTHTVITRPAMADEALRFHDRREREIHAALKQQAAELAAAVASSDRHPFWLARAASADDLDPAATGDPAALREEPAVRAAFEDMRHRERVRLAVGPRLRIEPRAAVRGREIAYEEHLVLPEWPDGIRYLRNVDLVLLARLAPDVGDVGALAEAVATCQPGVSLPDILGALSVLVSRGVLSLSD
jgi:flavin-dependent dehydrogenase